MDTIILIAFCFGYALIALENKVKINKAAIALLTGGFIWTAYILFNSNSESIVQQLVEHIGNISQIIFYLIGAMTIVELIDSYNGFDVITKQIKTSNERQLLLTLSVLTFFLSSVLDNLTTTIVMVTLIRRLLSDQKDRLLFVVMIIVAANSGGAWTPIGDVTTTMLWIGGQITTVNIMRELFVPSLVSMLVPLLLISLMVKGQFKRMDNTNQQSSILNFEKRIVFFTGIAALIFVPVFKFITNLPPFMGMLTGLSVLWIVTELLNKDRSYEHKITVTNALRKIDIPSVLFFLGILLAVAALESTGLLSNLAAALSKSIGNLKTIAISIGMLSSLIDNVPLVAASMGMYDLHSFPTDHYFWKLIAYCAGTGGSILVIGSAAGVAAMGIEKIDFFWYLKKISWIALIGYLSGAFLYIFML
ncbi:sodium:proton antiporter NhaD [Prolixibacter sp. NT017]|uniref:sodium:proton antiporter NhaD n=1 Tax=Prolixibacter sp. NT017 TaxID=2652390 RepID=UPI001283566F|nr:sodium:proton antiporter NhaD [Prolixibacter sp. NT017]GET24825.1 sodium:proton antiporter [Prolixibacter sp. NT017]